MRKHVDSNDRIILNRDRVKVEVKQEIFNVNKHFNFIYEKFVRSKAKISELILGTVISDFFFMLAYDLSGISHNRLYTGYSASNAIISDPELYSLVQSIAAKSGIYHDIEVYILPDDNIPGMTIGFTRLNHIIAISKKIRTEAPIEVLKSIIAHECGHIKRQHTIKQTISNSLVYIGLKKIFDSIYNKIVTKFEKNKCKKVLSGFVTFFSLTAKFTVIFSLRTIGKLISMKVSRIYEYSADQHAAELFGSDAMIKCLEYIEAEKVNLLVRQYIKTYFGINIMNQRVVERSFDLNLFNQEWFCTHPNTYNRIERLKKLNLIGKYPLPIIAKKTYYFIENFF
jgi:Zn-dependent protease with chaperone function